MTIFQNAHALIIGVGADLPNTIDDANGLAAILRDEGRCAYPPSQIHQLTGPSATRAAILTALDALAQSCALHPASCILVYFSGHGYQVSTSASDAYFLLPYGYDVHRLKQTAISGAEFTAKLRAIPAQKLLVLLDCCHAGGVGDAKAPGLEFAKSPLPPETLALLAEGKGRVLIASSKEDELSYAGKPYSAFTLALIESLSGVGVARQDGFVRVADVALHAREVVPGRTKGKQHPILHFEHADNFALAFYASGDTQPKGLPFDVEPEIELEPDARIEFDLHGQMINGPQYIINRVENVHLLSPPVGNPSQKAPITQETTQKDRRIDAAVPSQAKVGQSIDLLVQVRFPDSKLLGIEGWPTKVKPSSIEQTSDSLALRFPIDSQGELGSTFLDILVTTSDFKIVGSAKRRLEVPPHEFSKTIRFLLAAKREGDCRINVEVYRVDDNVYLGTIPLETIVEEGNNTLNTIVSTMRLIVQVEGLHAERITVLPAYVDQREQTTIGPQTNIAGNVTGPVLSGQFDGPVAVGGGEAVDMRGSQGAVYKPSGPVKQHFGERITITGDGSVIGNNNRVNVNKSQTTTVTVDQFLRLLDEMRQVIPQTGLDPDEAESAVADLDVVERQARKPQPKPALILAKLNGILGLLATADGVWGIAERVRPLAEQALTWAGQLFR